MVKYNKLYYENIKKIFFGGYTKLNADSLLAPLVWILHTLFLPLTLTIGAGITTIIDIITKIELTSTEIIILKNNLKKLNDLQIKEIVNEMLKYYYQHLLTNVESFQNLHI